MKKLLLITFVFVLSIPQQVAAWSLIPGSEDDTSLAEKFKNGNFEPKDIVDYGLYLIQLLIEVAGVVAVILVMIGGYRYVIGSFVEDKEGGKKTLKYALFGFSVCVLSWIIVELVISLLTTSG